MMTSKTHGPDPGSRPPKLRARGQLRVMAAIALGVMFTLASAAAQLMPGRARAPERRPIDDELAAIVEQRKVRIAQLEHEAPGERCHPPAAHELARLLVMDGRWTDVRRFADGYERRCGEDPVVRTWGNAPEPRARR
jgi:hypothetical protein